MSISCPFLSLSLFLDEDEEMFLKNPFPFQLIFLNKEEETDQRCSVACFGIIINNIVGVCVCVIVVVTKNSDATLSDLSLLQACVRF